MSSGKLFQTFFHCSMLGPNFSCFIHFFRRSLLVHQPLDSLWTVCLCVFLLFLMLTCFLFLFIFSLIFHFNFM